METGWKAPIEMAVVAAIRAGVPADEVLVGLASVLLATARGTAGWLERDGYEPDVRALVDRAVELALSPDLREVDEPPSEPREVVSAPDDATPLEDLQDRLTVRASNVLANAGYTTVGEIRAASDRELLTTKRVSRAVLNEVRAVLRGEHWERSK